MRNWLFFSLILILGALELTFLGYFRIFNIKPDLFLLCAVLASLMLEASPAVVLSLFAGLLKDSCSSNPFGINTVLFFLWSLIIIKLNRKISLDNNFLRMGLVFIVALLNNSFSGITLLYLGRGIPLGIFLRTVLIGSLYTALAVPPVFSIIKRFIFNNYRLV
ncbi:MAG: rod shape-determining protein MreD [Candidatus Omnitrophota bacterium]